MSGDDAGFGRCTLFVHEGQQTGLCRIAERFDIFQNQRTATGFLQKRQAVPIGVRPEKTLGQLVFLVRCAGEQHELLAGLRAHRVQRMGHQRLARPRLAVDQHMAVGLPQVENVFAQALHHGRSADQFLHQHQRRAVGQLAPQGAVVQRQAAVRRGLLGQFGHPVGVEGLFEKIERTDAHGFNRHRHISVAGDHDDRQRAVDAHQALQECHPVHAGHLDVADHDTGIIRSKTLQRVFRAAEGFGVVTRKGKPLTD